MRLAGILFDLRRITSGTIRDSQAFATMAALQEIIAPAGVRQLPLLIGTAVTTVLDHRGTLRCGKVQQVETLAALLIPNLEVGRATGHDVEHLGLGSIAAILLYDREIGCRRVANV